MTIFSKPYPKDNNFKRKVFTSLIFGNFIFLFLIFFQPFGISEWEIDHKALRLLGYGIITGAVMLVNSALVESIFKKLFIEKNWKVWKEILWVSWNIFVVGTFNLLYSYWQIGFELSFSSFLTYQWITLLIGLFPVTIITLLNYNRLQAKNLAQAKEITAVIESEPVTPTGGHSLQTITLAGENSKDFLDLKMEDIIYMESADNYVKVVWEDAGGLQKKLLRNTLKNFEEKISEASYLYRCHRSYIVNLHKVVKVSGNSQGYKLHLTGIEELIPVSRNLNDSIREKIGTIHKKQNS